MRKRQNIKFRKGVLSLLLVGVVVWVSGCSAFTQNTANSLGVVDAMKDMKKSVQLPHKEVDRAFTDQLTDFSFQLFDKTTEAQKNGVVSPLSVFLALSMAANGADGETLAEMERLLGGKISLDDLNQYAQSFTDQLPNEQKSLLHIANAIWVRGDKDSMPLAENFLQNNMNYYDASVYYAPFNKETVKELNDWVSKQTNQMIDRIVEEVKEDVVMFLVNAIAFDAEWMRIYDDNQIRDGKFTNVNGEQQQVKMMYSKEGFYLQDDQVTGFIKPYYDDRYSFVALLPKEGLEVKEFASGLNAERYHKLMDNAKHTSFDTGLPKFSQEYTVSLNETLQQLGMEQAFEPQTADFSKMVESRSKNIFISDVMHKAFIEVDAKGTKAGAVTKVEASVSSAMPSEQVILDRPFMYMIVENNSNVPLFMGIVNDLGENK